ncbi:exostosin family protein [Mariniflexile fucanivorans]|uniref:Exostosin family protein n=1 Tax=Mariniflexile fucanivorans TaxID=264023 RepID=A0A4R1RDF0_9FLAO|nr:exostosin family protein [Mariniflexile fucanivorans]TCL63895.1 exostosin family protein [Mariniflexile fucanivorans]
MLKLYTDIQFLTEAHRKSVFPLLFDLHYLKNEKLSDYYVLSNDVSNCDVIVFPTNYSQFIKFSKAFKNLLQLAKKHDKPIWIYSGGDYGFTTYIKNSITFRLGGFDSKLSDTNFILPSFINDPYLSCLPQGFSTLKKENEPTIGFVGHAKSGIFKYAKELLIHFKFKIKRNMGFVLADKQSFYPSSIKRAGYLHKLRLSKGLKTHFILRNHYRAGVQTQTDKQTSTQEFYNNIFNNAYTFCSRGVGNFSVRFYETLAVGRIPILLNTDCRLPLNDIIDWSKHCVILDETRKMSFENQIMEFHNSKTEIVFEALQKSNRALWETHLMRPSYFIKVHDAFLNKVS